MRPPAPSTAKTPPPPSPLATNASNPMSVKSLMRSGMISHSAGAKLQVLKGTRPQPSKMAAFDGKERDDGKGTMGHAIARKGQINGPDQKPSHMSKGGKEPEGRTPTRSQINTYPA